MMNCRIHRGTNEIGATCVELEAEGYRIVLDLGLPLSVADGKKVLLPPVEGLLDREPDPTLLGVLISHPHPDHFGLLPQVKDHVPVYIGAAAGRILREATFFAPMGRDLEWAGHFEHRGPFRLGPFTITPYLNDHSGFDAYGFLVEAGGRRLYYSGDFRGHGRKSAIFQELLRKPPEGVHVMLLEGTHIRDDSDGTATGPSEQDVETALIDTFRDTEGMALVVFSAQNIDRMVSVYRAAIQSGRDMVMDLYAATMARATGRETVPQAEWDRVRVYLPRSQRARVIQGRAFERTDRVRSRRIFADELVTRRSELVLLFRSSMCREIEAIGCLDGAKAVWSLWPGYLTEPSGERLQRWLHDREIPMVIHHSSGHAHIPDLVRLAEAVSPDRIVPIHSAAADRFGDFLPRVERRQDREMWKV